MAGVLNCPHCKAILHVCAVGANFRAELEESDHEAQAVLCGTEIAVFIVTACDTKAEAK